MKRIPFLTAEEIALKQAQEAASDKPQKRRQSRLRPSTPLAKIFWSPLRPARVRLLSWFSES